MHNIEDREAINKVKNYYENIIAKMPGHIFWKDRDAVLLGCNDRQAETLGLSSREEVVGRTNYDMIASYTSEEDRKRQADEIDAVDFAVMQTGRPRVVEEPLMLLDGSRRIYLSNKSPMYDESGQVIGLIGISFDISAEKEAERLNVEKEKAQQRIQLLKTLAASIAHELRTPIAGIMHGAKGIYDHFEALLDGYEKAVKAGLIDKPIRSNRLRILKNVVESIFNQSNKGNLIIDLLLKNISAEAIDKSEFGYCSMVTVIDNALNEYPMSPQEEHLIKWDVDEDFEFFGDPDLMQHVIWNLLKNALYFITSERNGEAQIWLEQDKDENRLHFKDTAKGISEEEAGQIFDMFYTNRKGGTGVGLNFCKLVMGSFDGSIECHGKKGKYTEFVLRFPKPYRSK